MLLVLRDTETTIKSLANAKVCAFGCGLEQSQTESKGTVLLRNADELLNYNNPGGRALSKEALQRTATAVLTTALRLSLAGGTSRRATERFEL